MSTTKRFIDFAAVKSAVTMSDILGYYSLLDSMNEGSNPDALRGCCPIHGGDNPKQFSVSLSKNCWNCFSDCQRGGNVLDFVALMEQVDVHAAALLLDDWFSLGLLKSRPAAKKTASATKAAQPATKRAEPRPRQKTQPADEVPATDDAPPDSNDSDDDGAVEANPPLGFALKNLDSEHVYFAERGLDPETVETFGLGYCNKGTMAGRIVIPIHNPIGQLVAYVGRWPGEPPEGTPKYKFPKGFKKSLELFNQHRAFEEDDDRPLVVVEGFFGCMRLWQLGYRRVVALMGCKILDPQHQRIGIGLPRYGTVSLLFDKDSAGKDGALHALNQLVSDLYVRVVDLPEGIDQADELTAKCFDEVGFL